MDLQYLEDLESREVMPGFWGRIVHTDASTLAIWRIEEGAELQEHRHVNEQTAFVLEGTLEMTVEGETQRLGPGAILKIPPNVPHSGRAVTEVRVIDVFVPRRQWD